MLLIVVDMFINCKQKTIVEICYHEQNKGLRFLKLTSRFNKYLLIFIWVLAAIASLAQTHQLSSTNKKALKYYNKAVSQYQYNDFNEAINSLNNSIKHDKNFIEAWLLLGDSYIEVNSIKEAIKSYESAISIDSIFFPGVYYLVGNLNYKIGEYQKATDNYVRLSHMPNVSKELLILASERLIFASTAAKLVENPEPVLLENIGSPINTNNDEYINYLDSDNNFMMLTRRTQLENSVSSRPIYTEELLFSNRVDSLWDKPQAVDLPWKGELELGSLNISTDGRSMYFTGCYWPLGQGSCDLYVSHSVGDEWMRPKNLGRSINTSKWESQPIISSDSKKLFFASKRAGGKGGSDIWMSIKLKNNSWSPPINLGDSINTPKDEMSPFLHADGKTLFFSSTGHPGLGGYDLFVSRQDELGRWSLAKNIGYPTNSRFDDINIFMSIDGKKSWISSNRDVGNGNMDIYSFNNYQDILPKEVMYVEGTVVDKVTKEPLKAEVQITNLSTLEIINTTFSDSVSGSFLIIVYPGIDYAFNISKEGYLFLSENIKIKDSIAMKRIKQEFELSPIAKGNQLVMNNVFFKFNEFELLPSSFVELDKLTELLNQNPKSTIEIIGHTDSIGNDNYNISLSLKRAKSVGNYLIENGIKSERLSYKGMGSSLPLAPNISETGRAKNRRTEILIK